MDRTYRRSPCALKMFLFFFGISLAGCQDSGSNLPGSAPANNQVRIDTLNPAEAEAGEQVSIVGQRFGDERLASMVTIDGVAIPIANYNSWSDNEIVFTVPVDTQTATVQVRLDTDSSNEATLVVPWDNSRRNPDNVAVSTAVSAQDTPAMIADGEGGAIVVWEDNRSSAMTARDIFAQRINSSGEALWTINGVAVTQAITAQTEPQVATDGNGGGIFVWKDSRNSGSTNFDIYAQKVNSTGTAAWTGGGVAVTRAANSQDVPRIVKDGSGGAYVVWEDLRNGAANQDIYAQRINIAGEPQWPVSEPVLKHGDVVCNANALQETPLIVSDDAGGAIVVWVDSRDSATNNKDIYAQRVNSEGTRLWLPANGVPVSVGAGSQSSISLAPDGSGGVIVVWEDNRNSGATGVDIYAQRINASGTAVWSPARGVLVSAAAGNENLPKVTGDGMGGAIIAWEDYRDFGTSMQQIYVQHVDATGETVWADNGILVNDATVSGQLAPGIATDGNGGAIVTWVDNSNNSGTGRDIHVQRIDSSGQLLWNNARRVVSGATANQENVHIVADGHGGAIMTWEDQRNGNGDIYIQGITSLGTGAGMP